MNIIIRKAKIEEANIADSFLTKLIRDEKQYDNNINEAIFIIDYYKNFINKDNYCLLFATIDNNIVGYIYGYIKNDGDTVINKVALLDALYVEEEYRNNGVADQLIKEFKRWSKENNCNTMEVNVCSKNTKAKNLYLKNSFETIKETLITKL